MQPRLRDTPSILEAVQKCSAHQYNRGIKYNYKLIPLLRLFYTNPIVSFYYVYVNYNN